MKTREKCVGSVAGSPLGRPLLIYTGTEITRKNMPLLLQVLGAVRVRYPDAQLLKAGHAGSGAARARTLALAHDMGLIPGKDVLFLDRLDDNLLAAAYRAADVFVTASLYEGFGLPALESMAAGTPVVVTDRGSMPEMVAGCGWTVEPHADAFAEAIGEAIEHGREPGRVARGVARAAQFAQSQIAERYLHAMRQVVAL